jgi:transcription-repair coupling factor (superfamily II helicase)
MKLVSRNTKRGAQFTPQGFLRWPLASAKAEDVFVKRANFWIHSTQRALSPQQFDLPK